MRSFYIADEETISSEMTGTAIVVAAGGEIDYAASPQLRSLLTHASRSAGAPVIVDLSAATFIDSTAIGVLVTAATRLDELGSAMAVVCTDQQILEIFAIVGLESTVGVHGSREEALSSFASLA